MKIKEVSKKNIPDVLDLFALSDPKHIRSNKYYLWRNFCCNFGKAYSYILINDDKIIAHYSILPQIFNYKNNVIKAGLGQQAVVHPEYRNLNNILELVEYSLEKIKENNFDLVYGFPNKNFYLIQDKIMKWDQIGRFKAKEINIKDICKSKKKYYDKNHFIRLNSKMMNKYKEQINELIKNNLNSSSKITIKSNFKYLKWRYLSNPENHYIVFCYKINKNIKGIVILKLYYDGENLIGHIVDQYSLDKKVNQILFNFSINYLKKLNITRLVLWNIPEHLNSKEFFCSEVFTTNFYSKNLNLSFDIYKNITNINNWDLRLNYSDAF